MAISNSPEQNLAPKPDPFSPSDLRRRPSAKTAIPADLSAIPDSSSNNNASLSPDISGDVSTESSIADASSGVDERDPIPNDAQEMNGEGERIANGGDRARDADVPVRFTYRPSVPAHRRVKESPLSSDAIFRQSHAGLFNLCIVVLVAVNSRLIIENLMKYGLLIRAGFWFSSKSLRDWPLFMCCLSLSIFSLLAFVVEKMAQHKFISELVVIFLHTVITTSEILYPIFMILRYDSAVQSGFTLMLVTCIVWLKLVSYAHTNYDLRALNKSTDKGDASFSSQNPDNSHNVNIKSLAYFMVAPTLCYQPSYPRTACIRKGWVIRQVVKLVIFTGVMGFIIEQYINPIVKNSKHPLKGDFLNAVERVLKLSVPTLYVWLCMFYCFFHLWLNILAELLCFGDREFYKDWWNAKTIEEPVHKWMVRHIYFPCLRNGIPKGVAVVIAFFFSAVFHELCVGIPCHIFKLWAFIGIMLQVPLVILTNYLQNKFKNTMVGNMVFWFFFSILGQPMCVLLYYHDLMNRSKVRTS
ncbi:diacylglycerol O-acyltransferase 1 isoform X2 [Magnolia sinica]|uniref:diacylglycerol O-acyltransferase 1 isoform X2 n=1 Tax=Magnolia sinica TaxID=86752 RepID=UPI002657C62E|nr:diacylglycerol O-acyltransferase 1 isoform X2 [Magnolia sinica]